VETARRFFFSTGFWKEDQKVFLWMQLITALAQVLEQVLLRHS